MEARASSLYYEITPDISVEVDLFVRNTGTRRLDNVRVTTEKPLGWQTRVDPEGTAALEPEEELAVHITVIPPVDAGIGSQEVKVKTDAFAYNRSIEAEEKTIRILVQRKTPLLLIIFLSVGLIGLVTGIVIFGIRLTKR